MTYFFRLVFFSATLLLSGLLSSTTAFAAPTAESVVHDAVTRVRNTVIEKSATASPEAVEESLKAIIYPVFDFREMSKRCLGANWPKATPPEQEDFVTLFSDLLARNYLKQIRENAAQSEFTVGGGSQEGERALVRTKVKYDGDNISIDYRLLLEKGTHWKVYDVIIENIGLVSNYRNEFANIIKKEGMQGLLVKLREKKLK